MTVIRQEFTAHVEDQALKRADGKCEECGGQLKPGRFQVDHIKPCALGGDNSLENAQVLCVVCHVKKSMDFDMPEVRKADRKSRTMRKMEVAAGQPEIARRFGLTKLTK
jgi:5-methylcytosine-specific restriction protein A